MGCFPPKGKLMEGNGYSSPVNLKKNNSNSSPSSKGKKKLKKCL